MAPTVANACSSVRCWLIVDKQNIPLPERFGVSIPGIIKLNIMVGQHVAKPYPRSLLKKGKKLRDTHTHTPGTNNEVSDSDAYNTT